MLVVVGFTHAAVIGAPAIAPYGLPYGAAYGYPGYPAPAIAKVAKVDDYDPNPQYSFSYDVQVHTK